MLPPRLQHWEQLASRKATTFNRNKALLQAALPLRRVWEESTAGMQFVGSGILTVSTEVGASRKTSSEMQDVKNPLMPFLGCALKTTRSARHSRGGEIRKVSQAFTVSQPLWERVQNLKKFYLHGGRFDVFGSRPRPRPLNHQSRSRFSRCKPSGLNRFSVKHTSIP